MVEYESMQLCSQTVAYTYEHDIHMKLQSNGGIYSTYEHNIHMQLQYRNRNSQQMAGYE